MPTIRFKGEYSHITLTTPKLKIFRPKINKAYFATAKIEEVTTTNTTETVQETYVVAGGDSLSKIASKKGTTVDAIIKSDAKLTDTNKNKLKVGQKITLPNTVSTTETNKKITFTKVNEGNIGNELYIIVETQGFQGYTLYINIKQGKEKGIEEKDALIRFKTENGQFTTIGEVKVGALCESHYMNVDDYAEMAILKVNIDHNESSKKELWIKALEKSTDKKTPLYLLAEGHTVPGQEEININYHGDSEHGEIRGEAVKDQWLDSDGNWFELKKNIIKTIKIYHTGKIDKVDLKDASKVKYIYVDSNDVEHKLKGEFDLIEVDELNNGETISTVPKGYTSEETITKSRKKYIYDKYIVIKGTKDTEKDKIRKYKYTGNKTYLIKIKSFLYSSGNLNIEFNLLNTSTRPYINPNAYASALGAIAKVSYKDITIVGFTSEDNHGFPSKTHVNGNNGDFRYLRKDKSGDSLHINTNPKKLDKVRQEKFIDSLKDFGWKRFYSFNYTIDNKESILKDSDHLTGHHHHLHLRQYKTNFKK
ncbi:LysM peptidoglycan-binding domain-containing protein [Aquimarina agarivorans]|uniref:LysM peptidoglycan-binding domain-containing protein n=1 Tax=Aquimarina agarivorans TaxID=980584 RepID=UPI000248F8EA|nr:LysM peptidoglycan-binding domain-containing protein [Aquimarina agarivorans]